MLEVVDGGSGSLADHLVASRWTVVVAVPVAEASAAVAEFLTRSSVPVTRMTKKGLRTFDCREAVVSLVVRSPPGAEESATELDLTLRPHRSGGATRRRAHRPG